MKRWRLPAVLALATVAAVLSAGPGAVAQENAARESRPPNILLAIADDWSFGHAGAYGCRWVKTPAFDRVAREGVLFRRAYTPNAKCAPSRACLLTGRNSWQLKEAANHWCFFPPEFKTYPEALSTHGYFAGTTGKGWGPGVAQDAASRPRRMTGQPFSRRNAPPPTGAVGRNDYAGNFEEFLAAAPAGKPWCFWYGATEPHRGYEPGSGAAKGGKSPADVDRVPGCWPDSDTVRHDMLDYAFEVEHFDRHLGRILELLERRGELENTLVVVTSDHGMPFPRVKGQAYEASNHVPLAVRPPARLGGGRGRVVEDYVSFIDLAPTLMELAGLDWAASGMQPSPGRSLVSLLKSRKSGRVESSRDHVLVGKERHDVGRPMDVGYPIRGIQKDGMLYLHNFAIDRWPAGNPETGYLNCDGGVTKSVILEARRRAGKDRYWDLCFDKRPAEELYDLRRDPDCLENLAGRQRYQRRASALREQAFRELKAQGDPRMLGQGDVFDRYLYADPSGRDFYERFRRGERPRAGWVNETDFEKEPLD